MESKLALISLYVIFVRIIKHQCMCPQCDFVVDDSDTIFVLRFNLIFEAGLVPTFVVEGMGSGSLGAVGLGGRVTIILRKFSTGMVYFGVVV